MYLLGKNNENNFLLNIIAGLNFTNNKSVTGALTPQGLECSPCCNRCLCRCTDFMFLVDNTGSMGGNISLLQDNIEKVINGGVYVVNGEAIEVPPFDSPSCFWSLATFKDYEDKRGYENGWIVQSNFESDATEFINAVNQMSPGGGGDAYEQNLSALKNAASQWTSIGGRSPSYTGSDCPNGVKRVVVCSSDVRGWTRQEKPANPYPETVQETTTALVNASIKLIAWDVRSSSGSWAQQASPMASTTGGAVIGGNDALTLLDALCIAASDQGFS